MNSLELFFLDYNFSWFWSKLIPYLLFIVFGFILFKLLKRIFRKLPKWVRLLLSAVIVILPLICYFTIHPIYEGDFSNNYRTQKKTIQLEELEKDKLIVISIPDCPYCFESIAKLKKMKKRNPTLAIEFIVCTSERSKLDWYKESTSRGIDVVMSKNTVALSELAMGRFPTFVFVAEDELKIWPNDNFGVLALDEIEEKFTE